MRLALALLLVLAGPAPALAQVHGHVSLLFDVMPDVDARAGDQTVTEFRARVFVEHRRDVGEHIRLNLAGHLDGLLADRDAIGGSGAATDVVARPTDLYVDVFGSRFDVRLGASRVVWGRLDEFQPTDVVNPIDLTRFLLEGRSEARLAVGLARGRVFLSPTSMLEAVLVPRFRASRFDQLDEASSPFNLIRSSSPVDPRLGIAVDRREPDAALRNLQGGARFTSTLRRVDWGVSAFRGFRSFPTLSLEGASAVPPRPVVVESFPRFTMVGGDFETVRGPWGVRGEIAAFVQDELQSARAARGVPGQSIEAGLGLDRRAGDYRIAANVLWSWRAVDASDPLAAPFAGDPQLEGTDMTLVVAADRSFARETRTLRVFAVYDPGDATAFGRVIAAFSLRDNLSAEGSAGLFAGSSLDTIGQLTQRDFVYARLKVLF